MSTKVTIVVKQSNSSFSNLCVQVCNIYTTEFEMVQLSSFNRL